MSTSPPLPVAMQVTADFATFEVEIVGGGRVHDAPPIAEWAIGLRFSDVYWWVKRKDRSASFAWRYDDGTIGEVFK